MQVFKACFLFSSTSKRQTARWKFPRLSLRLTTNKHAACSKPCELDKENEKQNDCYTPSPSIINELSKEQSRRDDSFVFDCKHVTFIHRKQFYLLWNVCVSTSFSENKCMFSTTFNIYIYIDISVLFSTFFYDKFCFAVRAPRKNKSHLLRGDS